MNRNQMNRNQISVLWGGIILASLVLLFPPHAMMPSPEVLKTMLTAYDDNETPSQVTPRFQYIRYAFVYSPPMGSVGIDWPRLLLPLSFIGLVTFGGVVSLKSQPSPKRSQGAA